MGIDDRLAVMAVSGSKFNIADQSEKGMMEFVGLDSNGTRALAEFSEGRL